MEKRVMKKLIYIFVSVLLFTVGCSEQAKKYLPFSNSSGDPTSQNFSLTGSGTLTEIRVTPANAQIARETYGVFSAEGIYSNGNHRDITSEVTWNTADTTVSEATTTKGRVSGIKAGSTQVVATLSSVTGSANLTVTNATLVSVTVSSSTTQVASNTSAQYTATAVFSDGTTQDVTTYATWATGSTSVATVVSNTPSSAGQVTGIDSGNTTVIASLPLTSGTVSSNPAPLRVTAATLTSIQITGNLNPVAGTITQLTATGIFSDGSNQDLTNQVTWATGNASIALQSNTSGTKGTLTAIAQGSTTVTASMSGITGTANITIPATAPSVVSIAINGSVSIVNGLGYQYTAIATYSDGTTLDVSKMAVWNSSNNTIATVVSNLVNGGSLQSVSAGSATVTATFGGITSNVSTVTVSSASLVSIAVTPSANQSLNVGGTLAFTATGTYSNNTTANITSAVIWASSSTGVATISNADDATKGAATGIANGSTNITASLSGQISNTVVLNVSATTLVSIAVTPNSNLSLNIGGTQAFTATGTYSNSTTANITSSVTWTSSSTGVATISNANDNTKGLATGIAGGSTNITASLGGQTSNAVALNVSATTLVSIAITPSVTTTIAGLTTTAYIAIATYSNGTTADVTSSVTWNSSSTGVATISNAADASLGKITGIAAGSTNITATLNGVTSSAVPFTVTAATLTSITVNAPTTTVVAGLTTNAYTATGHYNNGTTADITSSVTWASSATGNASISNVADASKGKATGVAAGSTNITASLGGVTSSAVALTVNAATLVSIAITPANPTNVIVGTTQSTGFVATGTYNNGTTANITSSVTWNSSSTGVATISNVADASKGKATGVSAGSTNISATDPTTSITSNSVSLTVDAATLLSINVTGASTVSVGAATAAYVAMGTYNDGLGARDISGSVTWSSSDTAKATINGGTRQATGILGGSTNITASLSGVTSNAISLTVQPTLANISVTPATPSVNVGGTQQFTATANYNGGASSDVTNTATWSSSNTGFATITAGGLATGVAAGSPTITATFSGMSGNATLTVNAAVTLTSISISPKASTIVNGFTQQFTATGTYSNGTTADLTTQVTWGSNTAGVATISNAGGSNGLLSSVGAGTTTISASLGAVNAPTTTLTVSSVITLTGIYIGTDSTYPTGSTKQYTATGNFSDGSKTDITTQVTWTSSLTGVATISDASGSKGLATAVAAGGPSTITATKGAISGTAKLTISATNDNSYSTNFTGAITSTIPIDLIVTDTNSVAVPGVTVKIFDASTNGNTLFQALSDGAGRVTGELTLPTSGTLPINVYAQAFKGGYSSNMETIQVVWDASGTLKIKLLLNSLQLNTTVAVINGTTITDTDGDGIADEQDAYPNDPTKAFKTRFPSMKDKVYTLAIENNWPNPTSNKDLNDYVVQFYNEEDSNASGKIVEIRGNYEILVRGRFAYESQTLQLRLPALDVSEFRATYFRYDGTQRPASWAITTNAVADTETTVTNPLVITNPSASDLSSKIVLLPKSSGTANTDILLNSAGASPTHASSGSSMTYTGTLKPFRPGDIGRVSIKLNTPATRAQVGKAPYDIYLRYYDSLQSYALKEVHSAGSGYVWSASDTGTYCSIAPISRTDAECVGKDKYMSNEPEQKFTWGMIVPGVWKMPKEGLNLDGANTPYSQYTSWVGGPAPANINWYKAANINNANAYQILPKPNKHLCLDCDTADAYDPGTAGVSSGLYYCGTSAGSPSGCVLGDLPTSYATTADVAFVDEIINGGSQLMAYISKSAKNGTARGTAAAIAILVGAILAGRIWRNSRKNK